MLLGAEVLLETMVSLQAGTIHRVPQEESKATYAPIMNKSLGRIDWSKSANYINNLIRGTYPWPGAFSTYEGKVFKLFSAETAGEDEGNECSGCISRVSEDSITVSCGTGSLRIKELQFENEKRMDVEAYLRGHEIKVGAILGE